MERRVNKSLYWIPRILTIAFLCFLAVFSLDVFEPGKSAGQVALGLFMHNIPVFVLAIVLAISWKRELVGAIVFTIIGALFLARAAISLVTTPQFALDALLGSLPLAVPAILIGILFFINWRKRVAGRRTAETRFRGGPPSS